MPRSVLTIIRDDLRSSTWAELLGDAVGGIALLLLFIASPFVLTVLS